MLVGSRDHETESVEPGAGGVPGTPAPAAAARGATVSGRGARSLRVVLLCTAFNGLSQRVARELVTQGHLVRVVLFTGDDDVAAVIEQESPDLVLCPFLKSKVPARVFDRYPTIVLHPGPVGDGGPSSLDRAIMAGRTRWGLTALRANDELDAGPVWAHREFDLPAGASKSEVYGSAVTEAAVECALECAAAVVAGQDPGVEVGMAPRPIPDVGWACQLKQDDRAFSWDDDPEQIVTRIRAADGQPGVRATLGGRQAFLYDAHLGSEATGEAGEILATSVDGRVLVGTGGPRSVWVGRARVPGEVKVPAVRLLEGGVVHDLPPALPARDITYRREGEVGVVEIDLYNGALSIAAARRWYETITDALQQDTTAIVLLGRTSRPWCNGIDLAEIEAAEDPAETAWRSIIRINQVCRLLLRSTQPVVAALTGGAGAGGAMLPLCADLVVARRGVVLNPYYHLGLTGSELHSLTLPRRVGQDQALRLLTDRLPVDSRAALRMGLVDSVGPADVEEFRRWVVAEAQQLSLDGLARRRPDQADAVAAETAELQEMRADIKDDRDGFAAQRRAFLDKVPPTRTPVHLERWIGGPPPGAPLPSRPAAPRGGAPVRGGRRTVPA